MFAGAVMPHIVLNSPGAAVLLSEPDDEVKMKAEADMFAVDGHA
jgi:hypothetical protein